MTPPFDEFRSSGAAGAASEVEAEESRDAAGMPDGEPAGAPDGAEAEEPAGAPDGAEADTPRETARAEQAAEAEEREESQQPEPSVPAGEPEGPTGPAIPLKEVEDGDAPEEDRGDERQLERDLDELAAKAEKADEYLQLAQRTRADFENYRKRAAREAAAAQERGVVKLVKELLPAVDNLDRALQASSNGGSSDELISGIKLVHAEVIAALNRTGVELYSPAGERFDPTLHEAVAQQPVEGAEPGTVVEVYQQGCRLGDSVIRPARVVVAG